MKHIPFDIQQDFGTSLVEVEPTELGKFEFVSVERTRPGSWEEQRIIVEVGDESDLPFRANVAFSFSTAPRVLFGSEYEWRPPITRGVVLATRCGEVEHIQGSYIRPGEPGGVTVVVVHPLYSSDCLPGCGMLQDHTGMRIRFRLVRPGVLSYREEILDLKRRVAALEKG